MNLFKAICLLVLFLSFSSCNQKLKSGKETSPPNIILIISDDAGYSDFGFTGGNDEIKTPNLDQLASNGIIFNQGYVTAAVCCPSRMGLMTGRYQQRFGAECNVPTIPTPGFTKTDLGLDTKEKTMADVMQSGGYQTMMIGKWHLGVEEKYHPLNRGFDEFFGFLGGSRSYWPLDNPRPAHVMYRNQMPLNDKATVTYLTDDLTDAAIDFVNRQKDKPFFIYLSFNAPHTPMDAKEEDIQQYMHIPPGRRRKYAAMTKSMDDNIGRLHQTLKEKKLAENTMIVFINDNGGAYNNGSSNSPLRAHKGTYWEGGIRVPYFIHWPKEIKRGQQFDHPVSTLDLLPTFAAVAKCNPPNSDGKNLFPFIQSNTQSAPHDFLYWRMWRAAAVRQGPWKLIRVAEDPLQAKKELLLPLVLINLEEDPKEKNNLAEKFPERANQLLQKLENWEKGLSQPRWYDGRDWPHWAERQVENHKL